jgi:hypothetical protein
LKTIEASCRDADDVVFERGRGRGVSLRARPE